MSKDIEKIIEDSVVPEMKYSTKYDKLIAKTKSGASVTIDELPEIVLPKTKAEVYKEAKGRLKQKSSAVSKRTKRNKTSADREVAAADLTAHAAEKHSALKPVIMPVAEPVWVGGAEDLIPFAWRNPLDADIDRPNKYYRQAVREARELLLPVPHDK